MTQLAHRYEHGIGCPRDIGRALFWYKRAAADNEPGAMVALGDLYDEGRCVERDASYAREMYQRAADLGFPPAMMRVAGLLETREREQAVSWYSRAAGKGYGPAMTRLGDLLNEPAWWRKAIEANHPPAFAKLAAVVPSGEAVRLWTRGAELEDPTSMTALALHLEDKEPERSDKLLLEAAERGDARAMERYAVRAQRAGHQGEAVAWFVRAAEAGYPAAVFQVARLHEEGRAVEHDTEKALRLYKQAADAGHVPAITRFAKLSGNQAMLRAAADAGDADAMFELGWMERAAAAGHVEALARIGRVEEAAAKGHAASLLALGRVEDAARAGDPEAMRRLGQTFPDRGVGMSWIKRAAEAGNVQAMRELGEAYSKGDGVPRDSSESHQWLVAAADKADPPAMFLVGRIKESAEAGYPPAMVRYGEMTSDRTWFERAASRGYANAWTKLGDLERAAQAGDAEAKFLLAQQEKNARRAYALYLEAAGAGYAPAMRRIGDCHMNGRGASRSEVDAVNWYRRAAAAGDAESLEILSRLGKSL